MMNKNDPHEQYKKTFFQEGYFVGDSVELTLRELDRLFGARKLFEMLIKTDKIKVANPNHYLIVEVPSNQVTLNLKDCLMWIPGRSSAKAQAMILARELFTLPGAGLGGKTEWLDLRSGIEALYRSLFRKDAESSMPAVPELRRRVVDYLKGVDPILTSDYAFVDGMWGLSVQVQDYADDFDWLNKAAAASESWFDAIGINADKVPDDMLKQLITLAMHQLILGTGSPASVVPRCPVLMQVDDNDLVLMIGLVEAYGKGKAGRKTIDKLLPDDIKIVGIRDLYVRVEKERPALISLYQSIKSPAVQMAETAIQGVINDFALCSRRLKYLDVVSYQSDDKQTKIAQYVSGEFLVPEYIPGLKKGSVVTAGPVYGDKAEASLERAKMAIVESIYKNDSYAMQDGLAGVNSSLLSPRNVAAFTVPGVTVESLVEAQIDLFEQISSAIRYTRKIYDKPDGDLFFYYASVYDSSVLSSLKEVAETILMQSKNPQAQAQQTSEADSQDGGDHGSVTATADISASEIAASESGGSSLASASGDAHYSGDSF